MQETNKYIVNADTVAGQGHVVHTNWCTELPPVDNQILLGHFKSCWEAIDRAKALDINAKACVTCCKECHVDQ